MDDSCTSVSLSFVGSIVYLPATKVESGLPIFPSNNQSLYILYYSCHFQLGAERIPNVLIVLQILCTRPSWYSLSGTGVTFCGKALSPLGLHALHYRAVLEVAEVAL